MVTIREFRLEHEIFERPLIFIFEIIMENCKRKAEIGKRTREVPKFLLKSRRVSGIYRIGSKLIERILKREIFSAPAGEEIAGCREAIRDVSLMFPTVPVMEGDVVARIPVVVSKEVYFLTPMKNLERTKKAIFIMKPQNFGFLVCEEKTLEEMISSIENKIKSAFEVV